MQDFSPSRLQLDFSATDLRQSWASLYADAIRQLEDLQEIEWLLTETEEFFSIALSIQTEVEEAAVRESSDQAAVLLRPKPASKASVEALEKLVFDGEVDYQCVVCMEEMVRGDQVTCLPCSHVFHGNCVIKWLKLSHTCPACRFKLPTE